MHCMNMILSLRVVNDSDFIEGSNVGNSKKGGGNNDDISVPIVM